MPRVEAVGPLTTGSFASMRVEKDGCFSTQPLREGLLGYHNLRPECAGCPMIDLLAAMPVDPLKRNGHPSVIRELILCGETRVNGDTLVRQCECNRITACRVLRAWNEGVDEKKLPSGLASIRCYGVHP